MRVRPAGNRFSRMRSDQNRPKGQFPAVEGREVGPEDVYTLHEAI